MARRRSQRPTDKPSPAPVVPQATEPAPIEEPATPVEPAEPEPEPPVEHAPGAPWLTVERVLWGALITVAAFVRLFDLGRFSLTDAEAVQALASLHLWNAAEAPQGISPLLVGLNALVFALFGASDASARLVPALAGLVPVVATYRLRALLGRVGALAAGALFALSATYVFHSRAADGEILAMAGIVTALVGGYEYLQTRHGGAAMAVAAGAAVGLSAGTVTYTAIAIMLVFAALAFALRARRTAETTEWESAWKALYDSPDMVRASLVTFGVVLAGGATAGLLYPPGLQATLNLAANWLGAFTGTPLAQPTLYLDLFTYYELLALIFGLGGLLISLSRGDRLSMFLACWLGVALAVYTVSPHKIPAGMLVILLPLILAGGRAIGALIEMLSEGFSLVNEGTFILLGLVTAGIMYVNLTGYAAQSGSTSHLAVVTIGAGMLLMIGVMIAALHAYYHAPLIELGDSGEGALIARGAPAWGDGTRRAAAVIGAIGLCGLAALSLSGSMNLNFRGADDPREAMVLERTTLEARALKPLLEGFSDRWLGDPTVAPVAAHAGIGAALRWYLRDFQSVRLVGETPPTASEPIVLVPAAGSQPGFAVAYASQRLRWRWLEPEPEPGAPSYLRWLLYRGDQEVLPSYDIIVYVQQR